MTALVMSEFGMSWRDALSLPVAAAFDLIKAHRKNNEIER